MFDELILLFNWQPYALVIIPLIFHWLIFPSKRAFSIGILNWVNIITLVLGLMMMLNASTRIWEYYHQGNTYWYLFLGYALRLILMIGLFIKNARQSIALSLVIAFSTLLNPIIISITNFHRDYTEFNGILDHFNPIWYQLSAHFWQGIGYLSLATLLYLLEVKLKK